MLIARDHLGVEVKVGDRVVRAFRAGNSAGIEIRTVGKVTGDGKVQLIVDSRGRSGVGSPVNTGNLVVINENLMDS